MALVAALCGLAPDMSGVAVVGIVGCVYALAHAIRYELFKREMAQGDGTS